VWRTLGAPGGKQLGQARGITGMVYKGVRGATELVGKGVDSLLAKLQPLLEAADDGAKPETPQRESVIAALNGVMGDSLMASNSPFAMTMSFRHQGEALNPLALPPNFAATGKVLLLIHGLCMSDLAWHAPHQGQVVDHGEALASSLGCTPVYLRYNSGLHTSQNGHELSAQLEQLLLHWPTPVDELTVVAHSMGGLLIRSAFHYARKDGLRWPAHLKSIVFLGTPHHGAPMERAGNWVDTVLGSTPFTAPIAKLGHVRSAGITDLRHGNLLDEDWVGRDRFALGADRRQPVGLPEGVRCASVAASLAQVPGARRERFLGDGLVPLASALGQHDDAARALAFAPDRQCTVQGIGHLGLLSSAEVYGPLRRWLG